MLLYAIFSVLLGYNGVSPILDLEGRDESCKGRTLFGIIWSCLSTTILCSWTAVHPNVPPPSIWEAQWNRLGLMFWMIIAPELVLGWAVRQFFAAKDIRDAYNDSREGIPPWSQWTLVHGHLLGMGGITLINPALRTANPKYQNPNVLTADHFKELIRVDDFNDLLDISEADIHDRSKGDVLFKLIAILQTSWFIIQCIARRHQRLALTELELVTLGLASLNAATFAIWWHKPLGVQEPVKIYWSRELRSVESGALQVTANRTVGPSFSDVMTEGLKFVKEFASYIPVFLKDPCQNGFITALLNLVIGAPMAFIYIISFPFFVLFPLGIVSLLKLIKTQPNQERTQGRGLLAAQIVASLQSLRYGLSSAVGDFVGRWLDDMFGGEEPFQFLFGWYFLLPSLFPLLLIFTIFLTLLLTLLVLVSFIFTSVFGIVTTNSIRAGASHVQSFYAPVTESDRWSRMVVFASFGIIFGGLHCIGWNFDYPTPLEHTLWRTASSAITIVPLIVAPIDFLLAARLEDKDIKSCQMFERRALLVLDLIMTILLFVYVPARLSLIAQALALLRSQPPSALVAVDWTKYVPHLFSQ